MRRALMSAALALALATPALADEVTEALTQAQQAYAAGDLNGAAAQIATASRALAQQQQQRLAAFLPEAPAGWSRELLDSEAEVLPFGTLIGVTAEARYTGPDGESLSLTLAADNPLVMTMAGLLGNPQMMAIMGRVVRINGQDLLAQDDSLAGLAGMRVLVQGSGMAPEKMRPLLEAIDFAALAAFDR